MPTIADADVDITNPDRNTSAQYLWAGGVTGVTAYAVVTLDAATAPTATSRYLFYSYDTAVAGESVRATTANLWDAVGTSIVARGFAEGAALQADGTQLAVSYIDPRALRATTALYIGRQAASDSWFPADIDRILIYWGVVHTAAEQAAIRAELMGFAAAAYETFDGRTATGLGPDETWSTKTAGWSTSSNIARLSSEDVEAVERCEVDLGSDDMAVEVVFDAIATSAYTDVGLNLRAGSSGGSPARYCVKRGRTSGFTTGFYEVRRYNGAGDTDITYLKTTTALAFVAGEIFRAEIEGNDIRIYRNSVLVDTITDSGPGNITSGHYAGLDGYRSTLASGTNLQLGSFEADIPAGVDGSTVDLAGVLAGLTGQFEVGASAAADLAGVLPALVSAAEITATADVALVGSLPAVTGSFDITAAGEVDLAGTLPVMVGQFGITVEGEPETVYLDGALPALASEFTITAGADVALAGQLPAMTAGFGVQVDAGVTLAGQMPALTGSFAVTVTGEADLVLVGALPSMTGHFVVVGGVQRDITVTSSRIVPSSWRSSVVEPPWNSSLVPSSWKSEVLHG